MRALLIPLLLLSSLGAPAACGRAGPPAPTAGPEPTPSSGPTLEDARAFHETQPIHLRPFPYTPVPEGLPDLRASTCGACHVEIYAEWKVSTHAKAYGGDAQFLAELEKSRRDGDVAWMCLNCHTPLENQLPRLVAGYADGRKDRPIYVDNPELDAELTDDAITCAVCHVRDGVVLGPWGDTRAPHPVAKSEELLDERVCTRCHQAKAEFPELTLACVFDTGDEWRAGGFDEQGKPCQTCHMPEVERPLMVGFPDRATRRHWFGGSMIPKHPDFEEELAPVRAYYPDGLTMELGPLPDLTAGAPARVELRYRNAEAGHMLPTGDPERFLLLRLEAVGPDGRELASAEARIGSVYQWHPEVKKLSDNRLQPREERSLGLEFEAPEGEVTLRAVASKWRLTQENVEYHELVGKTVAGREFARIERTLPVGP